MSRILCFFGFHKYKEVGRDLFRDVTFGEPGFTCTRFMYMCECCGKRKLQTLKGHWDKFGE